MAVTVTEFIAELVTTASGLVPDWIWYMVGVGLAFTALAIVKGVFRRR